MPKLSRRAVLKSGAILAVAVAINPYVLASEGSRGVGTVTPCLKINADGSITLCVPVPDMGQGMITTAAQMIADELEVNIDRVSVELMPFIGKFVGGEAQFDRFYQGTGGSGSTIRIWHELRRTAAYARTLLMEAAARQWRISRDKLRTQDGIIYDTTSDRNAPFADFSGRIRGMEHTIAINSINAKHTSEFSIIGKDQKNVHAHKIVTGEPIFGIDAEAPDMLHAVIKRCPYLKGDVARYDDAAVLASPGVLKVMTIPRLPEDTAQYRAVAAGVAVIATSYWQAKKAAELLEVEWTGPLTEDDDTERLSEKCLAALDGTEMSIVAETGDVDQALRDASNLIDVTYEHPHWAHTCLEPHSCTVHARGDHAEMWVSHQFMNGAINSAAAALEVKPENVTAHFLRMGTGLGRKAEGDFITEACLIAKTLEQPVKVTWSREDEMEQDYVNPLSAYRVKAGTDEDGNLAAWHVRAASDSRPSTIGREFPNGLVDHFRGEFFQTPNHISRGAWRGPNHNVAAWVVQSALDEMAVATGRDGLDNLISLYNRKDTVKSPNWPFRDIDLRRHIAVLEKVAQEADFGRSMPSGWGQGIAIHYTFVSVCAHVVDLEMISDNDFRVRKVTSAIDCGLPVNPLGIRAQVESGIIDGLCAAKYGRWVLDRGRVVTNNFDTYPKMRIDEAPAEINIHILDFGDEEPRGTGEVALPPIIPALTNAIFAASGKRVRKLPISENL